MKLPVGNKKIAILSSVLVVGAVAGVAALSAPTSGGADTSPLTTQVQQNTDELANHEARITNTETDVKTLQDKTGTAPSTTRVGVPAASSTTVTQTSTPAPAPVTVVSYVQIGVDSLTTDCKFTYSDGTVYQWHWKVVNPQGSWQTDGSGNNGHWVQTVDTNSKCDASMVGTTKS